MNELDELKQAIIDGMNGKQDRQTGAPRPQWQKDMELAEEARRKQVNAEVDAALGIDRSAPYVGHIAKRRSKRRKWGTL